MYWSIENVPWTNMHDLNLDWIVNTMKQTVEQWIAYRTEMNQRYADFTEQINSDFDDFTEQINSDFDDFTNQINEWKTQVNSDFADLQQYVQNYFDNLDLNESTRYVINNMIASGEFIQVLNPSIVSATEAWLASHVTPTSPVVDDTLTISGAAADAKATGDAISDQKNNLGALNITKYIASANGNYLAKEELDIDGKYFDNATGALVTNTAFRCGYVLYPKTGTYRVYQPKTIFGTAYLKVTLFKGDKTLYRIVQGVSSDEKVVTFTLTEDDKKNSPYIGISMKKTDSIYPMLLLNKEYPSDYSYASPKYNFSDLYGFRWMGKCPNNLNNALDSGWYHSVTNTCINVPSDYNTGAGCLIVLQNALNSSYSIQLLFDADTPPNTRMWYRYIAINGSSASSWQTLTTRTELDKLNSAVVINATKNFAQNVSLSGNYFDYEKAEWLDGFDTGSAITVASGYKHAFVPLQGPGDYIRVMYRNTFGVNCDNVCLFDINKNRIKVIQATRIDNTNGHTFTLSEADARTAAYITMNYREGIDYYYCGLYYKSSAYPPVAGADCPLPNYKPSTLPIYKSIFVCDGDSIAQGVHDKPKYLKSWWGRITTDYSATGKNYSVGGGTITSELYYDGGSPRHWINESIDNIYSEYPELDYLILDGGTNDADLIGRFTGDTPPQKFGTWTDTDYSGNYDNETFCGAVETMFYKAVNHWPKAKIGFIIAMQMGRDNNTSANRRRYFDEIKKIAVKWHIPVLDLWNESQMDSRLTAYYNPSLTGDENVTAKKCYYDGQHPTSYGYDLMQNKIDAWINSL